MKKIIILAVFFIFACHPQTENQNVNKVEIEKIAIEQQVPKNIMKQLDEELKEEFKTIAPLYAFLPLRVLFSEDQPGVILKKETEYNFTKGGGELDLKEIVVGEGSFYMSFPAEQFDENNDLLHLYFVSNSPSTTIDNELFGLGCGKWNDLKSNFKKLQNPKFLKLNTHQLRYLRVLAGTYVFVFKQAKNIYLTQLTLTDSRHSNQLCIAGANL